MSLSRAAFCASSSLQSIPNGALSAIVSETHIPDVVGLHYNPIGRPITPGMKLTLLEPEIHISPCVLHTGSYPRTS